MYSILILVLIAIEKHLAISLSGLFHLSRHCRLSWDNNGGSTDHFLHRHRYIKLLLPEKLRAVFTMVLIIISKLSYVAMASVAFLVANY